MGKAVRHVRGESQKEIVRLIEGLGGKYTEWEIWQDFITMSAVSVANSFGGPYNEDREKIFMDRYSKYSERERTAFSLMFCQLVEALEKNPDQDFLGDMFMSLGLGDQWKGQFFTPYCVCRAMAAITYGEDVRSQIEKDGWVSVGDCACGAGATLIAFASECRSRKVNYQTNVLFVGQDLDFLAGMMCYLQLSLLGCPGYVVIDDSIARPSTSRDKRGLIPNDGANVWYTPMYYHKIWQGRRLCWQIDHTMKGFMEIKSDHREPEKEIAHCPLKEGKAGQLSLFL